jgi:hypothetical protein
MFRLPLILGFLGTVVTVAKHCVEMMPEPLILGIFGVCLFLVAWATRGRSRLMNLSDQKAKTGRRDLQAGRQPMVSLGAVHPDSRAITEQVASQ